MTATALCTWFIGGTPMFALLRETGGPLLLLAGSSTTNGRSATPGMPSTALGVLYWLFSVPPCNGACRNAGVEPYPAPFTSMGPYVAFPLTTLRNYGALAGDALPNKSPLAPAVFFNAGFRR